MLNPFYEIRIKSGLNQSQMGQEIKKITGRKARQAQVSLWELGEVMPHRIIIKAYALLARADPQIILMRLKLSKEREVS